MEIISSIDLAKCTTENLKAVLNSENRLQLRINSKSEFDELMKSNKADLLYANKHRIVSLRGPLMSSPTSSIFEDTALIVSTLEDSFGVNLQYVTTLPSGDGKHIVELSEFFQDTISIFTSTIPFFAGSQFRTPYGIVEYIRSIYSADSGYDKMAYLGMSYDVCNLNPTWIGAEVCYAILDMIDEIFICPEGDNAPILHVLLWLAEMQEMGTSAYITLDVTNCGAHQGAIIENLIRGV